MDTSGKVSDRQIHLVMPYYDCGIDDRQSEILECIKNNLSNKLIQSVTLIVDDGSNPENIFSNTNIYRVESRPTYMDWIKISRKFYNNDISILANSDIYFDDSLSKLEKFLVSDRTFVALSRWDVLKGVANPHPNPHWSQDVWAFTCGESFDPAFEERMNIPLGVPRCDNKVAYQFAVSGWRLVNPYNHVKAYHLHETGHRAYQKRKDDRILGGVAYVSPVSDYDQMSMLDIDIWSKNKNIIKKVSINRSLENWNDSEYDKVEDEHSVKYNNNKSLINDIVNSKKLVDIRGRYERIRRIKSEGEIVYDHLRRFKIFKKGDDLLYWDGLYPSMDRGVLISESSRFGENLLSGDRLAHWLSPIIDTWPLEISEKPKHGQDSNFWQYPAATERQAFQNHAKISLGENFDELRKVVHTYLPLPWATFVDKKMIPKEVQSLFRVRVAGMRDLAYTNGYELRVHTVCQHIHWMRFLPVFQDLGITDLHLSHYEELCRPEVRRFGMEAHGWPLIAVNVENPDLSTGLVVNKPVEKRRYLASFIGAHMRHYRSDARPKLLEAARVDGGDDLLIEVTDEWHFNKVVYDEQVQSKKISSDNERAAKNRTERYNQVLSDSVFALCPEGAGPNTLRIWEAMAVGSIPVIIGNGWKIPEVPNSGRKFVTPVIYASTEDVSVLFDMLRGIKRYEIEKKIEACISAYDLYKRMTCY